MLFKEGLEPQHLIDVGFEGRLLGNLGADLAWCLAPAQQALELQPANPVKAVDHRVLDHPGRFAVAALGRLAQAQVFTQGRQRQVGGLAHYRPLQARTAAIGRRSR
ncbi:hypothetical protein D3C80_1723370 [compost metagenome]